MEDILFAHASRYPLMEPQDAVKLIYQNEFGGGHLIRNEKACLEFLSKEYASVPQNPGIPLLENIGNDMVRVNLAALDAHGISPEALGRMFIASAATHHGCIDSFLTKLSLLTEVTNSGKMPFSSDALQQYLADYEQAGFPPVSHSAAYRSAYRPAYRVVQAKYLPRQVL